MRNCSYKTCARQHIKFVFICASLFAVSIFMSYCITEDWPYSGWSWGKNSKGRETLKQIHHDRNVVDGSVFMKRNAPTSGHLPTRGSKICMVVITTHRVLPYINSLLTSLFKSTPGWKFRKDVDLHILNTADPYNHKVLNDLLEDFNSKLKVKDSHRSESLRHKAWHVIEAADYVNALRTCEHSRANWTILIEDDAITTNNFVQKFEDSVMKPLEKLDKNGVVCREKTAFVKLWHPDRWDGFEKKDIPIMIKVCTLLSIAITLILHHKLGRRIGTKSLSTSSTHCKIRVFLVFAFVNLMIYSHVSLIGKQSLRWFWLKVCYGHRHWPQRPQLLPLGENHVSGTVAMAYPTKQIPKIAAFLNTRLGNFSTPHKPIDLQLCFEFLAHSRLRAYEVVPSLAQHIGAYSSSDTTYSRKYPRKNQGNFRLLSQDSKFTP